MCIDHTNAVTVFIIHHSRRYSYRYTVWVKKVAPP